MFGEWGLSVGGGLGLMRGAQVLCCGATLVGCALLLATLAVVYRTHQATSWQARAAGRANLLTCARMEAWLDRLDWAGLLVEMSSIALATLLASEYDLTTLATLGCSLASIAVTMRQHLANGGPKLSSASPQKSIVRNAAMRIMLACGLRQC